MNDNYNEYHFTERSLRAALRRYCVLEGMYDVTSATILLDLRRALGDDPTSPTRVITSHQRLAIQRHLIEDQTAEEAARQLKTTVRSLYITELRGLKRLLAWLHNNKSRTWQPWMIALLHDRTLTAEQIAQRVNKTVPAVDHARSRYRKRESISNRSRSGRNLSEAP